MRASWVDLDGWACPTTLGSSLVVRSQAWISSQRSDLNCALSDARSDAEDILRHFSRQQEASPSVVLEDAETTSGFPFSFLLPSRKRNAPGKEAEQGAYHGWDFLRIIQATRTIFSSICPSLEGQARCSEEHVSGEVTGPT